MNRASYHSPRREQAAAATRVGILDAARDLFATHGYGRTTVAQRNPDPALTEEA